MAQRPEWRLVGDLHVQSGTLSVSDGGFNDPSRAAPVSLPNGTYRVAVLLSGIDGQTPRAVLLRAFKVGAKIKSRKKVGKVFAETDTLRLLDPSDAVNGLSDDDSREANQLLWLCTPSGTLGMVELPYRSKSVFVAAVKSCFDIELYDVYVLENGKQRIGLEVDFTKSRTLKPGPASDLPLPSIQRQRTGWELVQQIASELKIPTATVESVLRAQSNIAATRELGYFPVLGLGTVCVNETPPTTERLPGSKHLFKVPAKRKRTFVFLQ